MKKKWIKWLAAAVLLISPAASASETITLMLDWFPNVDHLPVYVARHRGLFEKAGLDVRIVSPSETSDALKLAASGNVDIAVSYTPQTVIAAARGLDVAAVGRLIAHPLTTILFLRGKGIETPADLSGRRIGYTVPGLMDVMLEAFAAINGVRDHTPVNVGFAIVQSLAAGKVDAVMGPFKTYETVEMRHRGYDVGYFELEKHGIPDYDELIFVCSRKTLDLKGEKVAAFVRAVDAAISQMRADPEKAFQEYLKEVPEADPKTESEAFRLTLPYFAAGQAHDPKRWQAFADFALAHKLIARPVDAARLLHTVGP
ncbi:ABC transporter substrate-binding protein [Desulfococcus sp.]|uniref:ABC transporter substrate-binding protein n=1 Tax=Desulfococcus sp. TaxID=2025834 RepID=UPI0035932B31